MNYIAILVGVIIPLPFFIPYFLVLFNWKRTSHELINRMRETDDFDLSMKLHKESMELIREGPFKWKYLYIRKT